MSGHVHPISRKRKERESTAVIKVEPTAGCPTPGGNRLLAGYLAHEFLTKGTLFGKKWPEPAGGSSKPVQPGPVGARSNQIAKAYDEVAYMLKTDAAHIPDVINPTQLGRWLQM